MNETESFFKIQVITLHPFLFFLFFLILSCEPGSVKTHSDVWSKLNDSTFIAVYKDDTIMAAVRDHEIFFGQWKNNTYYTFTVNAASGGMDFQANGNRGVGFLSNPEARGEIRIQEAWHSGENYVGIKAPEVVDNNITFTLPDSYGETDQILATDGKGVLLWKNNEQTAISSNGSYLPNQIDSINIEDVKIIAPFHFVRVGSTVSVAGEVLVTTHNPDNPSKLLLSLPLNSNLIGIGDCVGFGYSSTNQFQIRGDGKYDCACLNFETKNAKSDTFSIQFTYKIKK
jgi:hypothetical protein